MIIDEMGKFLEHAASGDADVYFFQQLAEANLETMQQQKVKKIISICPHCIRTIQEDWKEFGAPPEVEHHSEFLARHQSQLPKSNSSETVVFHDPCYLGRYRNVYDEPREVVEAQ